MIARAKALADDLLEVVRGEHAKALQQVQAQQMELHHAQMQYAAYTAAMSVCILRSFRSCRRSRFPSFAQLLPLFLWTSVCITY